MAPFTVLHVCMGNICRSPMAERLFMLALRKQIGDSCAEQYLSHGAGTGSWHVGEPMNPQAARQVVARGGDATDFRARKLAAEHIDSADLILCATAEQVEYVQGRRAEARARTFTLKEFARLLHRVDLAALPEGGGAEAAYARGVALVAAADAVRIRRRGNPVSTLDPGGVDREAPQPDDDLDDPWGMSDRQFVRVADEVETAVVALATALTG